MFISHFSLPKHFHNQYTISFTPVRKVDGAGSGARPPGLKSLLRLLTLGTLDPSPLCLGSSSLKQGCAKDEMN